MANITFDVVEDAKKFNNLIKSIDFLNTNSVYVGIPQAETEREEGEEPEDITNAELLFIHSNGSPVRNIPERPVIEPAIEDDADRLNKMLKNVIKAAQEGDTEKALTELSKTGMRAQNVCRAWFNNKENGWPEDSPKTIARKIRKHKNVDGYEPKTLIDTAQMRNAITYFVDTPEGRKK